MMQGGIRVGRILGIPVGLHPSWFLIFGLMTWSLASGYFPAEFPTLPQALHWQLGVVTSLLFFGSVLLHELGHSVLAIRNQVPVRGITLFLFGGVAQIAREPRTAGAEFRIAIAGPLTSLGLGLGFGLVWQLARGIPPLAAPAVWLARINLILAAFNMIPGFPLDGGRVLRALVWKVSGDMHRATQIAAGSGQLIAFGFVGWGVFTVLRGNLFNGLWLVFIGWFLQNAAAASFAQSNLRERLRGVKVAQVMQSDCPQVPGSTPLDRLVEDRILTGGERCFFVTDQGRLRGMLTLRDVSAVPRTDWPRVRVDQAMRPWDRMISVDPDAELMEAMQNLDDSNVAQVPVVRGDEVIGLLSREHILHYVRVLGELGG